MGMYYACYETISLSNLCGRNACKTTHSPRHLLQTHINTQHFTVLAHPLLLLLQQPFIIPAAAEPSHDDDEYLSWHKDLNWVIDILLSLAFIISSRYPSKSSISKFEAAAPTTWSKDLTYLLFC